MVNSTELEKYNQDFNERVHYLMTLYSSGEIVKMNEGMLPFALKHRAHYFSSFNSSYRELIEMD